MNAEISDNSIREIVRLANQSPSGDNCQPFRFQWDGKILSISHLSAPARHHYNYNSVGSVFALGMMLETISIAAKNFQLDTIFSVDLDTDLGDKICATAQFTSNQNCPADELYSAINKRVTDRRPYKGGDIDSPFFESIRSYSNSNERVHLYFTSDYTNDILDYITKFESYSWVTPAAHKDIFGWIHYDRESAERSKTGMPWESLGASYLESRILKLCQNYKIQNVLNKLGGLAQIQKLAVKMIQSAAALGCITAASLALEDLLEAGKLMTRTWLTLTKNEWGVQPYALNSMVVYSYLISPEDTHFNKDFADMFKKGKGILQKHFKIPETEFPCWVFRTGYSPNYPNKMRTLRLPVEEILEITS